MSQKATIVLVDPEERHVVEIDSRDRRAFEVVGRRDLGKELAGMPLTEVLRAVPETYAAWLAWHALTRTKTIDTPWPEFSERFLEAQGWADEPELDPTSPGRTPG